MDTSPQLNEFTLIEPDDLHAHVRQGDMLAEILRYTAENFTRALVMPNTTPAILTANDARDYYKAINQHNKWDFTPLMTIKITAATTPEIIHTAKASGIVLAGKLYPAGVTTNSHDGVRDFDSLWPVFAAMEEVDLVLCVHGELPGAETLLQEAEFIPVLDKIRKSFPKLRIVMEHISTSEAVDWVLSQDPESTSATVTVHHLVLTLDDVIGDKLHPHHFCRPPAKWRKDRQRLREAVTTPGQRHFFLGTDTAPHLLENKECTDGCAGVFTAPVAMSVLIEIFEEENALDQLERFTSINGATFYQLPLNKKKVRYIRKPWEVAHMYGGVVPFRAGQTLQWQRAS